VCYEKFRKHQRRNVKEWLQSGVCEVGFQNMTDTNAVNAAVKQKGEEGGGEDAGEIHTVAWRSLNSSQKQVIITNCFSK
jgi:hypothetical protein